MGYRIIFFALALLVFFPRGVQGQCVTIDYNLPSSACLNENLYITNTTPSGSYSWDFCTGDFSNTPSASLFFGIELASGRPGFDLVKDGAIWYGFFTGTTSNLLFRVTFGSGLNSAPTVTENLGNLGGTLNAPGQIRIVNENGLWFGLIHNTGTGDLVKLSFGTSLSNPVTTSLLNVGVAHGNGGFGVGRDVANGWVCVFSNTSNQFTIVRLGTTISSPQPSDILISSTVPAAILGDVEVSNVCGNWYAFASDFAGGRVFRASFGSNLFSIPTASQISTVPAANLGRIKFVKDGENHSLLVSALDGLFFKLDFGTDPTSTPVLDNEGNVGGGLPPNIYALDAVKENSIWTIITSSQGTGNAFKISYPNVCSAVAQTSLLQYPQVKFSSPSTFNVSLDYTNAGVVTTKTKSILIKSLVPPDIDFNSQNSCVSNPVNFSPINSSGGLTSYQWDFGDMNTATVSNPSNVYAIAASYTVVLTVSSSNSCSNTVVKPIAIYNSPIADFTIPSVNPFCTNQNYSFSNISGFDVGSNPSWEWRLNGLLISTQQNLSTPFMSATSQEIRLRAIIPGCSNEMIKTIPIVKAGPQVNFSVNDNCQNSQVLFTNNTGGVNTSYAWDFGDGGTSSQVSPTYSYSSANTFQSKLTVSNADGCQNFLIKPVRIYSLPQPDFSVSLPPFSCANSSTPFQNNTPPLTDSDLANWVWQFGDAVGGTSVDLSPSYTYAQSGNYSVTLTSTSDKGCFASVTKPVTIASSPTADFTVGPACANQLTRFTDTSTGGVQSHQWQIGPVSFGVVNPSYTFTSSGTFNATLTVTAANGCSNVKTRIVNVPVVPTQNFTVTNACAGKNTSFTDATSSPQDPVTGWNWNFAGSSTTGNPASYGFLSPGTFNTKLTTTHASGCRYTLSRDVLINPTPVASFTATPDRGAAPLTVQFNNTSQGATQYAWRFEDKVPATSARISPVYTFATLGDYSAQLTATNAQGCADILTMPIRVLVPVIDLVLTDFSMTTDPITGKLKGIVTIQNKSNVPVGPVEVALYLADKAVVNENLSMDLAPEASITKTLSFSLTQEQFDLGFLCAKIISEKDVQPDNNKRCINLNDADVTFRPYPNPTSGTLHVDWVTTQPGTAIIAIRNGVGKKVYEWETISQTGLNQTVHDVAFLSSGLYFLTIETGANRRTTRFFRQ